MSGQADKTENDHVVTFALVPDDIGTNVALTLANLTGSVTAADIQHRAGYEKKRSSVLADLAKLFH